MTFRAKPVVNRPHRPSRESQSRRNAYLNIGFGIAVVLALVILVGVAVVSYYREHLAPAASVNGATITRDDFAERAAIEAWRIEQAVARVNAALAAGRLTSAEANQQIQTLQSSGNTDQLAPVVIERLIDARIQSGLAVEEGITVTPEQIDAKIVEESTTPEQRHAWIISVTPVIAEGEDVASDADKAAAKELADQALADITSGAKSWEDVAKAVSTDSSKATGGDLGWIDKEAAEDKAFIDAVFAAEQGKPTAVLETEDGTYVIGRVTEISPETVDAAWTAKLADAGLKLEAYREVVKSEVIRQALEDKAIDTATKADKQRQVLEIAIPAPQVPPGDLAIKVRHILFSPNDNPDSQATSALAPDDPAWTEAQQAAKAAYDELKKDPTKFDAMAREKSDEPSAQGETGSGGKLPYFDSSSVETGLDADFAAAILKPELQPGQLLEPVKSAVGWHVIQVMYRPPGIDHMKLLREQAVGGADFKTLARDNSEGSEAGAGGDMGWMAPGLMDARLLRTINETPVGEVSQVLEIKDVGSFLYKVVAERTQTPDADQLATINDQAFQNWYGEKKDAATITRELLADLALGQ
jgi:parvulin-like peptidyl-prolyl isomerase